MKKKILFSLVAIAAAAAVIIGGTTAFFSDTETSTGNTFTAGAIDLKIDNTSYAIDYTIPGYQNPTGAMVPSPSNTWALDNLTNQLFFNFVDLKPGDIGEDTISIHVNNNDAYACMAVDITATPENEINEPEAKAEDATQEGELQNYLQFAFWADDGDNVYEADEEIFWSGSSVQLFDGKWKTLADAQNNVWDELVLPGDKVRYIAKAWCFGELVPNPVSAGQGQNPTVATGFTCNGDGSYNDAQTDGIMADVSFYAVQSRNNAGFTCDSLNGPKIVDGDLIPLLANQSGAMRVKAQAGEGIYLGEQDLGIGANRVQAANSFMNTTGLRPFTLAYDSSSKVLTLTGLNNTPVNLNWDTDNAPSTCTNWDVLRFTTRDSKDNAGIALKNIMFNATALGDFGVVDVAGTPGFQHWSVTGLDLLNNWTLTGDLDISNFNGNESLKTDITLGCQ